MIFVCCQLSNPHPDLRLPLVAIFGELGEEHPGTTDRMLQPLLDGKTMGFFTLLDDAVVGCEDIGPIGGDNAVDLRRHGIPQHTAFQPLVPMLRLDLALGIDFGCLAGGGDTGIDGSFALFVDFGSLAKENNGESGTSAHGYLVLIIKRCVAWNILRRKIMQAKAIRANRDLFLRP